MKTKNSNFGVLDEAQDPFEVSEPSSATKRPGLSLKARAVGLLSRREHSRTELQRKLAPHAENAETLEKLLDELAQAGWQSDARFTQGWLHRKAPLHGAGRLIYDLKLQGIDAQSVAQVQAELKLTEYDRAHAVWHRKFKQTEGRLSQADYARQGRFLAARGFSAEIIRRVLKQVAYAEPIEN